MQWFEIERDIRFKLPEKDEAFFLQNNILAIGAAVQHDMSWYTLCKEMDHTTSSVSGTEAYTLPIDFILVDKKTAENLIPDSVRYDDEPLVALNGRPAIGGTYPTGTPTGFYIWGNSLCLHPIPNETGKSIVMRYRRKTPNPAFNIWCATGAGRTAAQVSIDTIAFALTISATASTIYSHTLSTHSIASLLVSVNAIGNGVKATIGDSCGYNPAVHLNPTWSGPIAILDFKKFKTIVTALEIPSEMHATLINGILAELYLRDGNAKLFQLQKTLYESGKELFRKQYGQRNTPPEFHDNTVGGGDFRYVPTRDIGMGAY